MDDNRHILIAIRKHLCKLLEKWDSCIIHPYKIEKYWDCPVEEIRKDCKYDLELFKYLTDVEEDWNESEESVPFTHIAVNKCSHPPPHHQNVWMIGPENLIFTLKFHKFICNDKMYKEMAETIFREGVYNIIDSRIKDFAQIMSNMSKFRANWIKYTALALYKRFRRYSDVKGRKGNMYIVSKIAYYIGTSISYVGSITRSMDVEIYKQNEDSDYFNMIDHEIFASDNIWRLSYQNAKELIRKSIKFLFVEWSRFNKVNNRYSQYCVYFKDLLEKSSINNEDDRKSVKEFKDYTNSLLDSFDIVPQEVSSPTDVMQRLLLIENDLNEEEYESGESENKAYLNNPVAFPITDSSLDNSPELKRLYSNKQIFWIEGTDYADNIYCLLFLFFYSYYRRLDDISLANVRVYFSNNEGDYKYNTNVLDLWENIESFYKKIIDPSIYFGFQYLQNKINKFINENVDDSWSILQFIQNFTDNHPSFRFEVEFEHDCDKIITELRGNEIRYKRTPSSTELVTESQLERNRQQDNSNQSSNIELSSDSYSGLYYYDDTKNRRSYIQRTFQNIKNATTTFGENVFSNPLNEKDADIHYVWCNKNSFYPNITKYSQFFIVVLNYSKEWRNLGRLWRFKLNLEVKGTMKKPELKGVVFNSDDKYSVFSNSILYDEETGEKKAKWFYYDPRLSSIATRVPKSHFVDGYLEVKEMDYDSNAHPCLLFYYLQD